MKIEITSLDEKGRGLGEGYAVPYAYPGDIVEIEIVNHKKKLGKLLKLSSPSAKRQTPACKHFGVCGGCLWQGLKYEEQLKFKEGVVKKLFGDSSPIPPHLTNTSTATAWTLPSGRTSPWGSRTSGTGSLMLKNAG